MGSDWRSGTCMQGLMRLIKGASGEHLAASGRFLYEGGPMDADDVLDVMTPSILCLSQDLSMRLGLQGLGMRFSIGHPAPVFPIHVEREGEMAPFSRCAPLVYHTFCAHVITNSHDLARVYELAMNTIQPGFKLATEQLAEREIRMRDVAPVLGPE